MYMKVVIPVLAGFVLDMLAGDPLWLYHPVRLVGKLITAAEKVLRRILPETKKGELTAGILFALFIVTAVSGAAWLLCAAADALPFPVGTVVRTVMCYQLFAMRSLRDESMKVHDALTKEDIPGARRAVSMIVGRDTAVLDREGIVKAAVETVAENTSDGVIAPLLYMLIGGPVLGWAYKAVNTMDSMVGYKNDRYLYFGRAAAKLDDAANFVPARLSALLMVMACPLVHLDVKEAFRIFRRDRYNHASPNSAQTESVMAGALHVQLAGDAFYFGRLVRKKTIGDRGRAVEAEDIRRACRLLYAATVCGLVLLILLRTGWAAFAG